jgi:LDH2 family malate/lactate/ureidoglycolate dehydrogenase
MIPPKLIKRPVYYKIFQNSYIGDHFCLDMATTAVAVGKIEMQKRKGLPIPLGWAQDSNGQMTTDAATAFDAACLMFDLPNICFI